MLHAERCRLETAAIALVCRSIAHTIAMLEAELVEIEAAVAAHVADDPQLGLKEKVMCHRIGVAHTTARGLLAVLPQIGEATSKEITALGGIAPRVHQSGATQKRRGLDPGRTAMRYDPDIKAFAQRLRARGKPGKVIMVAVMRKMLVQLNAAVRDALNSEEPRSAALAAA